MTKSYKFTFAMEAYTMEVTEWDLAAAREGSSLPDDELALDLCRQFLKSEAEEFIRLVTFEEVNND